MIALDTVVNSVTSSLVLFSSIGIFVLTLNARYTQATSRLREIYDHLQVVACIKYERELDIMVKRCNLLKWSFGLLLSSAICSSAFLLESIALHFLDFNAILLIIFLIGSVIFIFSSMVFLFLDILASLSATMIHIGRKL